MRASHNGRDTNRGPGSGRRSAPWRAEQESRSPWKPAILTALLGAAALVLVFFAVKRHSAQVSAPYAGPTPESAPAAVLDNTTPAATVSPDMSDATLFRRLEWKEGQFVLVEYGTGTSTRLDVSGFTDPSTKNSHDLVEWAKMAWENQWGYVWGTFGYILTEEQLAGKLEQYPDALGEYEDLIREKWMGRRVVDCVGLIKSYGWYDPDTGGIEYGSGDMPDTGTDGMWDAAQVKGDIGTMPDEPGILVYSTAGHIGVYIGDGIAVEAISHEGGVVKTKVADRPWTGWLQCPYIRYDP